MSAHRFTQSAGDIRLLTLEPHRIGRPSTGQLLPMHGDPRPNRLRMLALLTLIALNAAAIWGLTL